jgi:hypothetical protein
MMSQSSSQQETSPSSLDAKPLTAVVVETKSSQPKRFFVEGSDFKKVMGKGGQLVDKTLFVKEVIETSATVQFIIWPRQFGRTSNLSLLNDFFDCKASRQKQEFKELNIWSVDNGAYQSHYKKYPVIFLSLKDIKELTFEKAIKMLAQVIATLYRNQQELYGFECTPEINEIIQGEATRIGLEASLQKLINILHDRHKEKVVVLIDEYDTPLREACHTASNRSYYRGMRTFLDRFLGSALKGNPHVYKAVLTGFLPPPKEWFKGIYVKVSSMLNGDFGTCFGFSRGEVRAQLQDAFGSKADDKLLQKVEKYYGGYQVGGEIVFNPWAVISFIHANQGRSAEKDFLFENYWRNSSSDQQVIGHLFKKSDAETKLDIISLISDQSVVKTITPNITFRDIERDSVALWSYMVLQGYLAAVPELIDGFVFSKYRLTISNQHIREFYINHVKSWLSPVPSVPLTDTKAVKPSKGLPLGLVDFKEIVEGGYQFVDKTAEIVAETVSDPFPVKVMTRPQHFGKTSYLSTLRYFFDSHLNGRPLFKNLSIGDGWKWHQGRYAVIFLSLKEIKATSFEEAMKELFSIMQRVYEECREKYHFELMAEEGEMLLEDSLSKLIEILSNHCEKEVVVLLDDYDAPLRVAYTHTSSDQFNERKSYYWQMCGFMDKFLSRALKNNSYLYTAILTGFLQPSKLQFPEFFDVSCLGFCHLFAKYRFRESFGFSKTVVQTLLQTAFGSDVDESLLQQIEQHYGGYQVEGVTLFNPGAIVRFIESNRARRASEAFVFPYETLGDDFVSKLLKEADETVKKDIMTLIEGKPINKQIDTLIWLGGRSCAETVWSFLLHNGFLVISRDSEEQGIGYAPRSLAIPNKMVLAFYRAQVALWSKQEAKEQKASSYPSHARFVGQAPPKVNEPLSSALTVPSSQSSSLSTANVTAHRETAAVNSGPPKATGQSENLNSPSRCILS